MKKIQTHELHFKGNLISISTFHRIYFSTDILTVMNQSIFAISRKNIYKSLQLAYRVFHETITILHKHQYKFFVFSQYI